MEQYSSAPDNKAWVTNWAGGASRVWELHILVQGAGIVFKAWAWVTVVSRVVTFLVSFLYSLQKHLVSHVYAVITTGCNWSHWRNESKMQQPFTYFLPQGDLTLDLSAFLFLWLKDNIPFESQRWLLHSFFLSFYRLLVACSKESNVTYSSFSLSSRENSNCSGQCPASHGSEILPVQRTLWRKPGM